MFGIEIPTIVLNYSQLVPYIALSFITAFFTTPLFGRLAYLLGALDLPAHMRKHKERGVESKINGKITPRLGGLAIAFAFVTIVATDPTVGLHWGIWGGLLVLTLVGLVDDINEEMPVVYRFAGQLLAASLVIASGIRITEVQLANINLDFSLLELPISALGLEFMAIFPADILTVIWILAIINFVNWMSGIDGLNGTITAVADVALLLIAMKFGNLPLAVLAAVHLGAVLGVLPFNYPPSKIFYGLGEDLNGFLLAVFAILTGGKVATGIIILGLPILDAIWVMFLRFRTTWRETKSIKKALGACLIGDRTHLHHRLLDVGYSWKLVILIEGAMMGVLATVAFYFSGFSGEFLVLMLVLTVITILFSVLGIVRKRALDKRRSRLAKQPKVEVLFAEETEPDNPEDKYAY